MKVSRLTAMALAALMASSTTSVAWAVDPGHVDDEQVLNFYPGAIGDDLYMMDEDGYIRAAAPGDFAPGDDIYLSLMEYQGSFSSKDVNRLDIYDDWDIGKSWVEDVKIVHKKGKWKESEAPTKLYAIQNTGIRAFDENVTFTTSKTEDSSILAAAKEALEGKRAAAEQEVFDGYTVETSGKKYVYDRNIYDSKEAVANAAIANGVYQWKEYHTVDGTPTLGALPVFTESGYLKGKTLYLTKEDAAAGYQWHVYDAGTDGALYNRGQDPAGHSGNLHVEQGDDPTVGTLAKYLSENGVDTTQVYINSDSSKYIILNHQNMTDEVFAQQIGCSIVGEKVYYKTENGINTTVEVVEGKNGYFKQDSISADYTELVGTDKNSVFADLNTSGHVETVPGDTYYIVDGKRLTEAEAKVEAARAVQKVLDNMTRSGNISVGTAVSTYAHNPTGSYDGYTFNSGFHYWLQISTKSSSTTKEVDIVGDVGIGTTRNEAKDNTINIDVTMTNADVDMDDEYEDFVHIDPDTRAVVKFSDDASDEFEVEFGDYDARFIFNARGQGKLNLAYNTKFDRDFAYEYDDANIDFITFEAEPTTNRTGTLYIYADEDSYIYEVTSKGAKKIPGAYYDDEEEAWVIRTRHLTSYAISDKKLKTVDQMDDSSSSSKPNKPNKPSKPGDKYNPDTGR